MENEIGMNMMKKILLVVVALLGLVSLQVNAQEGVTRTLYMDKAVKGTLPLTAKHGGDIEFFIRLELPDVEKVPSAYKVALTAVRDTILSKSMRMKYVSGDADYKKLTAQFETRQFKNLEGFIGSMDAADRDRRKALFRWYFEYSGQLDEDSLMNPMLSDAPFFQFYLQKVEQIGNTFFSAENLVFDSRTGQLLTLADLLNMTPPNDVFVENLMMDEFRKHHPEETDYDFNVDTSASFEITKTGLNFYIPTGNVQEDRLDYIFMDKSALKPFMKKGGLLDQFWK